MKPKYYTAVKDKDGNVSYELSKTTLHKITTFLAFRHLVEFYETDSVVVSGYCECGSQNYIVNKSYRVSPDVTSISHYNPSIEVLCKDCGTYHNFSTNHLMETLNSGLYEECLFNKKTYTSLQTMVEEEQKELNRIRRESMGKVIKFRKENIKPSKVYPKDAKLILFPKRESHE